jgi:hypothetical protein
MIPASSSVAIKASGLVGRVSLKAEEASIMGILVNLFLIVRLTLTVRAPDGFVKKAPFRAANDARDE